MEKYIRKLGRNSIILSIVFIFFGMFMFTKPVTTINILMVILGTILVLDGLVHLVSYFSIKGEYRFFSSELVQSTIYIILGFVLMCNYEKISNLLPMVLGIWIIVESIFKLQISLNIRDIYDSHWGLLFAMSIITGLLGAVILFNPFESLTLFIRVAGIIVILVEILSIFEDFSIISRVGKIEKLENKIEEEIEKVSK